MPKKIVCPECKKSDAVSKCSMGAYNCLNCLTYIPADNQTPSTKKDELFRLASLIGCEPESEERHRKDLLDYITSETKKSNKELFKALRGIWSNPPKEYVEQGSNELYWNRTSLLKILDTLEAEWENLNA
jgi:hypothetical protein